MKYKLTDNTIKHYGKILHQIECVTPFGNIKKGQLGGWIEKEENLSQEGDCWLYDNAKVYENAWVYGNAKVYENAWVFGNAWVYENAKVYGDANVYGNAKVCGKAEVCDNAKVFGYPWVYGNALVYGNAEIYGYARVCGNTEVGDITEKVFECTRPHNNTEVTADTCDNLEIPTDNPTTVQPANNTKDNSLAYRRRLL